MTRPYNPLDTDNLGESLMRAVMAREAMGLSDLAEFSGAGVYALYYRGNFPAYRALAEANRSAMDQAIYVGKAIAPGGRKGSVALTSEVTGKYLYNRLVEHRDSIEAAQNLDVSDFHVRWLVVESIWIPLLETLLIVRNPCVWNVIIEGFGNHDPGKNRHGGKRTVWDTLHPGRWWADRAASGRLTAGQAAQEAETWLTQRL